MSIDTKRFILKHKLNDGAFGTVYAGVDTHNSDMQIVLKLNEDKYINKIECNVLTILKRRNLNNFPELIS